jgi:hypothetical protein
MIYPFRRCFFAGRGWRAAPEVGSSRLVRAVRGTLRIALRTPSRLVDEKTFLRYNLSAGTLHFAEVVQEDFYRTMAFAKTYWNTPLLIRPSACIPEHQPSFFVLFHGERVSREKEPHLVQREEVRET